MQLDLSDDGRALLDAITTGEEAWSMRTELEAAGHTPETLASLETAELATRWRQPQGEAVTLTPWGKFVREVEILERPVVVQETEPDRDEHGNRIMVRVEREDVDLFWGREDPNRPRPVRLPYRRRQFSMPCPELIPDPAPGPEYLLDDDGDPVELFKGLFSGKTNLKGGIGAAPIAEVGVGVKVELDARLTGAETKKGEAAATVPAKRKRKARPRVAYFSARLPKTG